MEDSSSTTFHTPLTTECDIVRVNNEAEDSSSEVDDNVLQTNDSYSSESTLSTMTGDQATPREEATQVEEVHVNNVSFQRRNDGAAICVPLPLQRRNITLDENLCEEGYDSDCNMGPFYDAVVDEVDIDYYSEDVIDIPDAPAIPTANVAIAPSIPNVNIPTESAAIAPSIPTVNIQTVNAVTTDPPDLPPTVPPTNTVPPPNNTVPTLNTPTVEDAPTTRTLTEEGVNSMNVADLKAELIARGLSRQGLKAILLERLLNAVRTNMPLVNVEDAVNGNTIPNPED